MRSVQNLATLWKSFFLYQHGCYFTQILWQVRQCVLNIVVKILFIHCNAFVGYFCLISYKFFSSSESHLKGSSAKKIYFASNLIFWVGMGCGIGHLAQRGPKYSLNWPRWVKTFVPCTSYYIPHICHFLTPAPFSAQKSVNSDTDFATKQQTTDSITL